MRRILALMTVLTLILPLPVLGAEAAPSNTYEEIFETYTRGWNVERRLEAPGCVVVLMWVELAGVPEAESIRDYAIALIAGEAAEPEGRFQRLLLPSTAAVGSPRRYPTDRAPDEMFLNEGRSVLTYVYSFEEALFNDNGEALHEAGSYTYRVDIATGELNVSHTPLPSPVLEAEGTTFVDIAPGDWFASYVEVCAQEGLMRGTGEGRFSPHETLSDYESTVLALRLHDLGRGGDGSFEAAPWDWGYALLTLPDGTVGEGYLSDDSSWDWAVLNRGDSGHLGFRLDTEEEREWGRSMDYQRAVLTLNGKDYAGELHLSGTGFLYFSLYENYSVFQDAQLAPSPNEWWRDAWYYARENGLEDLLYRGNSRWAFACRMAAVTELPAVNEITGLPDTGDPDVLELYRAGVLTGSDGYGTFHGERTLTRAECAAICARILRPELRVSFSPKPLETYEDYTLTYLREDGARPGGPHRPMQSMDLLIPDPHSLLRLDGVELTVPEGYEVESIGEGLAGVANWAEGSFGLIDREGQFRTCTRQEVYENPLLSVFHYDTEGLINGYRLEESRCAFYNEKGEQVTPAFDWASFVDPAGAGFVGLDRKIYRIQFGDSEFSESSIHGSEGGDPWEYTLTELPVGPGFSANNAYLPQADYVTLARREGERDRYAVLTGDGRFIDLGTDEPCSWGKGLLALRRAASPYDWYGVMDLGSGEMVLPFGAWGWEWYTDCRFLQDGEHFITGDPEEYSHDIVWDREGNRVWSGMGMTDWWLRFHDGLRTQKRDGGWGYVDVDNYIVIEPQWGACGDFQDGYATVSPTARTPGEYQLWGIIDTTGELVIPAEYHRLDNYGDGMFLYTMFTPGGEVAERGMIRAGDGKKFPGHKANNFLVFTNGYGTYMDFDKYTGPTGWRWVYVNTEMETVSQEFDWVEPIGEDGAGFVGLDGRVFRIQFETQN